MASPVVLEVGGEQGRGDERRDADGYVEDEDPAPRRLDEQAAECGTGGGAERSAAQIWIAWVRCATGIAVRIRPRLVGTRAAAPTACRQRRPAPTSRPMALRPTLTINRSRLLMKVAAQRISSSALG